MIILAVQLRIFVLSIVSGWIYSMLSTFVELLFSNNNIVNKLFILLFHALYHLFLFYLLYRLNSGALQLYYVLLFFLGMYAYYRLYYPIIIPIYIQCIHYVKIPIKQFFLVFSQFISIIIMLMKSVKKKGEDGL